LIPKKYKRIVLGCSIVLYAIALSRPGFCTNDVCQGNWSGLAILFSGTFGFFLSSAGLPWLANPVLLGSWIALGRHDNKKAALIASLVATILLSRFYFSER